jgi:hypothetical protein
LSCAECEREADETAVGRRGYLVDADDEQDEDETSRPPRLETPA